MLKIRDDVDLKEIEKYYGFKYFDNCGQYILDERGIGASHIFINSWNRKIEYRQDIISNNKCLERLYDLIKANLIEKVGE